MRGLVLDVSVAAAWLIPDESAEPAWRLLDRVLAETATVPFIWRAEAANTLVMAERRGRLTEADRVKAIDLIETMPLRIDMDGSTLVFSTAYDLAIMRRLSLYDAMYLELALRCGLPLASFDRRLREAAKMESVELT